MMRSRRAGRYRSHAACAVRWIRFHRQAENRLAAMSTSTKEIVRKEFANLLREDHPGNFDEIPLAELGVDSLEFFEVTMILEDDHGIVIPIRDLHSDITLKDILDMLE
ncbi:MAG: acyl carrier protein [Gammaproteobacteria bacterium]|jgi:acyl carrier protein